MVARIQIATAVLVREGLVLLAHRTPLREAYPDCWGFVGGHVEPGESPDQAVRRECLEEVGVQIHDPLPIPMTVDNPALDMRGFLVTRWEGEPVIAEPEEHDDLRWFRPGVLADLNLAHPENLLNILNAVQRATA
ncbi:NUDIX domain-containing protein [Kribbella sp. NPDC003505]|uniref:NUDIX domain-containing protein n=1 Tax=Kribbella sp. NPDC003505 TaxID=3154448 RepID=UPI0033AA2BE6